MTPEEFLVALQLVELTRDQPKLKPVHDFMLKRCESHVEEIQKQLDELNKAEADKKAKEEEAAAKAKEAEAKKAEPPKAEPVHTSERRF